MGDELGRERGAGASPGLGGLCALDVAGGQPILVFLPPFPLCLPRKGSDEAGADEELRVAG